MKKWYETEVHTEELGAVKKLLRENNVKFEISNIMQDLYLVSMEIDESEINKWNNNIYNIRVSN